MSEKEYKAKCENMFAKNTILINENDQLKRDKTELVNSVTELKNKITELEKQIEKMKRCQNCKYGNMPISEEPCSNCKHYIFNDSKIDKWELGE